MSKGLAAIPSVQTLVALALEEDLGRGDITTAVTVGKLSGQRDKTTVAKLVARESLVWFGADIATYVFERVDSSLVVKAVAQDGDSLSKGDIALEISGNAQSLLTAERTALNFVQRLSGVATLSRAFAQAVNGTGARVVDTRKTTPGYRVLEKAAVLAGGCHNHRFDLGSGILIKDNHIAACGGVAQAIKTAKAHAPHPLRIEVEVDTIQMLREALEQQIDIVLLDNFTVEEARVAVELAHQHKVMVELSGGINLQTVRAYAETGADIISAGALTHSAKAVDLALDFA